MPVLAIDTATEVLSIALGNEGTLLDELGIDAGRSHLELLLPAVQKLLAANGFAISDLDAIAVGTGPGTFSGLRVGIATARGLAQALGIPVAAADTLEALARELAGRPGSEGMDLLPLVDARRGEVFSRIYRKKTGSELTPVSETMCLDPETLLDRLIREHGRRLLAAGNGALAYFPVFDAAAAVEVPDRNDDRHRVRAYWHLRAAAGLTKFRPRDLLAVTPVYIRAPDADKTVLLRKLKPWQ